MTSEEIPLAGGNMGPVVRRGGVVLRQSGPWTPAVHQLMRHCREHGLHEVPRPLGVEGDREALEFVPGTVPAYPMPEWVWAGGVLTEATRLLRRFHDASESADRSGPWRLPPRAPAEVICHHDFAPHNLVFDDQRRIVGIIDVDFATPGPRIWDLAHLAYRIVPLTTDRADGFSDDERRERLGALLDAYDGQITARELLSSVAELLSELAAFSRAQARELDKPELAEHARLYEADVALVRAIADRISA